MKPQWLKHLGNTFLICFSGLFCRGPAIQELPQQRNGSISWQNKGIVHVLVGEWGWGVEGKQVGSMDEESQVRGCYNITFICTPTNQPGNSVGSPMMKTHEHRPQQLNKQPASAGTLGEKGRCRPSTQLLTP